MHMMDEFETKTYQRIPRVSRFGQTAPTDDSATRSVRITPVSACTYEMAHVDQSSAGQTVHPLMTSFGEVQFNCSQVRDVLATLDERWHEQGWEQKPAVPSL